MPAGVDRTETEGDHRGESRDQVIGAIYEAVLRPELYGNFMELWEAHVLSQLEAAPGGQRSEASLGGPELEAHFRRAFDILERIGRDRPAPDLERFVEGHQGFALLVHCDGAVMARSAAAMAALDGATGLAALEEHLVAGSDLQLHELLAACRRDGRTGEAVVLRSDLEPCYLIARSHPVERGAADPLVVIEPLALQWSARTEALLERSFALSPAELELVRHLMAGHSLRQIAERTHRSEHTVRNQCKAVLGKTGSPSQAALIRLVAVLCRDAGGRSGAGREDFGGERLRLTAAGGRGFDLYRFGAPDGRPVLFLHGMMESLAALMVHGPGFSRRGLQVLAPIRPGYGRSDPLSRPEQAVEAALAQADAIWSEFDLDQAVVVGHMAGALHAHALAARAPDRVAGIVSVAGAVPIRSFSQLRSMARRQRVVAYTARLAPMLLPTILRAGIAQIDSDMIDAFAAALYPQGSHDHDVLMREDLHEVICEGYRFSVSQGHHGFLGDAFVVVRDWSCYLAGPDIPLHLLHGAEDPAVSIDWVREFCAARPQAELTELEECGQLVFFERPDLVLDAVEAMAGRVEPAMVQSV